MTSIAPHMSAFLQDRLPLQRGASEHTCDSYAYAFQLLFQFASERFEVTPSALSLEQLDAPLIMEFLYYLETERHNTPRTRNARLVAIKSFMRFIEYRVPSLLEQSRRILAIPAKKTDTRLINYLTVEEMQSLLNAPNLQRRDGIRDRAMLHLCFAAGLRVSELVSLPLKALDFYPTPNVRILGKRRKERILPLWKETVTDIREWLAVRGDTTALELFLNARGRPMTRSGFEYILQKHVKTAAQTCEAFRKKCVTPHVLRHASAMLVLQATGDIRKVALWLGHDDIQTTEIYLRADPTEKLEAIDAAVPPTLKRGEFRAPDKLMALLHRD
jgi:site-specific recombinase XerD